MSYDLWLDVGMDILPEKSLCSSKTFPMAVMIYRANVTAS